MRLASLFFGGFAGLVVVSIVAIFLLNPNAKDVEFLIKLSTIFGGIIVWAANSAMALRKGKGVTRSFLLLFVLSLLVFVGLVRYGSLQPSVYHPILGALRTACGLSIVALWIVLIRAVTLEQKHPQNPENKPS